MNIIDSTKKLDKFLKKIISNSVDVAKLLNEESEEEREIAKDISKLEKEKPKKEKESDKENKVTKDLSTASSIKNIKDSAITPTVPESEDISLDMIIKKLNSIRSGYSLKEKRIYDEMINYFKGLSKEERLVLWTYLNGISQILGGDVSGKTATDPRTVSDLIKIIPINLSKDEFDLEDTSPPIKVTG